jgi:hypothetical protein
LLQFKIANYFKVIAQICGASFTRSSEIKQHKAVIHAGKKPFNSKVCAAGFTRLGFE